MLKVTEHTPNAIRIALSTIALVLLALSLMGAADLGSTSPGMRGRWSVVVDASPTACGGSGRRRFDLSVERDGIRLEKAGATGGEGLRAVANGREIRFDVSYTNPSGVETLESIELELDNGVLTGTSTFTDIRGNDTCSASASVLGTR